MEAAIMAVLSSTVFQSTFLILFYYVHFSFNIEIKRPLGKFSYFSGDLRLLGTSAWATVPVVSFPTYPLSQPLQMYRSPKP